mgnify:FL=1
MRSNILRAIAMKTLYIKTFFNKLSYWYLFTLLVTMGMTLVFLGLGVMLGDIEPLVRSIQGWTSIEMFYVTVCLPFVWANVMVVLDWAVGKLNGTVSRRRIAYKNKLENKIEELENKLAETNTIPKS